MLVSKPPKAGTLAAAGDNAIRLANPRPGGNDVSVPTRIPSGYGLSKCAEFL
ncbi:MAG: hypothetical protein GX456_07400 [Verrucomicrobia bacterium]|nr:hypothetical protein [Verrucomicrobiota bacterium]